MPGWRNGIRRGLKIPGPQGRVGSTPTLGTFSLPLAFRGRHRSLLAACLSSRHLRASEIPLNARGREKLVLIGGVERRRYFSEQRKMPSRCPERTSATAGVRLAGDSHPVHFQKERCIGKGSSRIKNEPLRAHFAFARAAAPPAVFVLPAFFFSPGGFSSQFLYASPSSSSDSGFLFVTKVQSG